MSSLLPILGFGSIPGFFASLIAFIVTYDEYTKHYVDKRMPLRLALEAAIFAFFVVLAACDYYRIYFDQGVCKLAVKRANR